MATHVLPRTRLWTERRFFTGMSLALAVVTFVGFAPSYYLSAWGGVPSRPLNPAIHLHGALCTAWLVLLVLQSGLVAARRTDLHRLSGVIAVALVPAVFASGVFVAIAHQRRVHNEVTAGTLADPYVFLAFPLFAVGLFALFALAGLAYRRRSDIHKRLMLIATITLVMPSLARIVTWITSAVPGVIGAMALIDLFLALLAMFDVATRGRLHPATLWGGGALLLSEPLRTLIAFSEPWQQFARALMG